MLTVFRLETKVSSGSSSADPLTSGTSDVPGESRLWVNFR